MGTFECYGNGRAEVKRGRDGVVLKFAVAIGSMKFVVGMGVVFMGCLAPVSLCEATAEFFKTLPSLHIHRIISGRQHQCLLGRFVFERNRRRFGSEPDALLT